MSYVLTAGSTLLYLCQKIASSNCIYIRSLSCKAGEQYVNWLKSQGQMEMGECLNYDQAVEAYNLYQNTEKAELHNYLKRPKVGNIYKFRLIFMESAELKRLKKIMTAPDLRADVTLLSATFSSLLLGVYGHIDGKRSLQFFRRSMNYENNLFPYNARYNIENKTLLKHLLSVIKIVTIMRFYFTWKTKYLLFYKHS